MNKKITYLLISFFAVFATIQAQEDWTQIGQDIDGEAAGDNSGYSISLSSDGSIVAIGAPYNNGNGTVSGHVRIYENQSGIWAQIGQDIDGEAEFDWSGYSVSLSSDGSILAIGARQNDGNGSLSGHVRVYENLSGTWTQIGQDIDGEAAGDYSGASVSLSSDGLIVAIGAFVNGGNGNFSGHVRVYENQSGTWTQVGQDIDGEAAGDYSGISVSLSSDGSIVAIGAFINGGNGPYAGHVRIYKNQSGTWTQIGQDIDGEAAGDYSGSSVSISSNGTIVAIGAPYNDGNGNFSGHVRIFENLSGTWIQIGQDIDGEVADDRFGGSLSLNSDGSIVAIGARFNDGNATDAGHVRIFENQSGIWTQLGQDIDGEVANEYSGGIVSLNSDGSIVAIGAPFFDSETPTSGHVPIYKYTNLQAVTIISQPANQSNVCPGSNISFSVTAENADSYQWQESTDGGNNFTNIINGGVYNNTTTETLTITGATTDMNNYQFRCVISNTLGTVICNPATLTTDNESPLITSTHNDQIIDANANCQAILPNYASNVTATDNCDANLDISQNPTAGSTISEAINIVTLTVTDDAGNFAEVSFNVEVEDNTNPVITSTHNDQIIDANANCQTNLPNYASNVTATDNCDANLDISQSPTAGTTISGAINTVTITVIDDTGNFAEVSFNVEVEDNTNPTITCVGNQTVDADETNYYIVNGTEFDPTETNDNCAVSNVKNDFNNTSTLAGAQIPEGITTIVWTITDISDNTETCSFDIAVDTYLSIQTLQDKGISIYPIPTNRILTIDFKPEEVLSFSIVNIAGKQVFEKTEVNQNETVDLSGFESGVYLLIIHTDNEIITTRIIKE